MRWQRLFLFSEVVSADLSRILQSPYADVFLAGSNRLTYGYHSYPNGHVEITAKEGDLILRSRTDFGISKIL